MALARGKDEEGLRMRYRDPPPPSAQTALRAPWHPDA